MRTYRSQSTVTPDEWDAGSSANVVYHNENVETQPATDETPEMCNYDVTEYTREEYTELLLQKHDGEIERIVTGLEALANG